MIKRVRVIAQLSDEELNEMTIVHAVEESEAAAEVTSDQSTVRRPVVFEKASNENEELLIHQEGIPFTSNGAIEPVITLKLASARVIDVQQLGNFVLFSDLNLVAERFPHLFHSDMVIQGQKKRTGQACIMCKHISTCTRRVAQDDTFPLVAFDIVSRKRAFGQISLMCKIYPTEWRM